MSSFTWEGFVQHKLRSIMCPRWHWISLVNTSLDIFCVLPRHGICLFNTSSDIFYTLAGMRVMFDTRWDIFFVLAGMGEVLSKHFEIHFVVSLACDGFRRHMLKSNLCPQCHGMGLLNTRWDTFCPRSHGCVWYTLFPRWHSTGLVNTCLDVFCVLAGEEGVFSTHVEMHFVWYI